MAYNYTEQHIPSLMKRSRSDFSCEDPVASKRLANLDNLFRDYTVPTPNLELFEQRTVPNFTLETPKGSFGYVAPNFTFETPKGSFGYVTPNFTLETPKGSHSWFTPNLMLETPNGNVTSNITLETPKGSQNFVTPNTLESPKVPLAHLGSGAGLVAGFLDDLEADEAQVRREMVEAALHEDSTTQISMLVGVILLCVTQRKGRSGILEVLQSLMRNSPADSYTRIHAQLVKVLAILEKGGKATHLPSKIELKAGHAHLLRKVAKACQRAARTNQNFCQRS